MRKGGLHLVIRCVQVSFGVRSESDRGPFGVRSGSVQDPFGVPSGSVRSLFGVRSGSETAAAKKKPQPGGGWRGEPVAPPSQRPIRLSLLRSHNFLEP